METRGDETNTEFTRIVDPLDGTTNYAHHHPVFAVSIGLVKRGEPYCMDLPDCLASNSLIHEELLAVMHKNVNRDPTN